MASGPERARLPKGLMEVRGASRQTHSTGYAECGPGYEGSNRMLRTRSAKVVAVAALALGGLLADAGAASAYVYGDYTTSNVKIRDGASQSYRILGSGYPGDHEYDFCY